MNWLVLQSRAEQLASRGYYARALAILERLSRTETSAATEFLIGKIQAQQGKYELGRVSLNRALSLDPRAKAVGAALAQLDLLARTGRRLPRSTWRVVMVGSAPTLLLLIMIGTGYALGRARSSEDSAQKTTQVDRNSAGEHGRVPSLGLVGQPRPPKKTESIVQEVAALEGVGGAASEPREVAPSPLPLAASRDPEVHDLERAVSELEKQARRASERLQRLEKPAGGSSGSRPVTTGRAPIERHVNERQPNKTAAYTRQTPAVASEPTRVDQAPAESTAGSKPVEKAEVSHPPPAPDTSGESARGAQVPTETAPGPAAAPPILPGGSGRRYVPR